MLVFRTASVAPAKGVRKPASNNEPAPIPTAAAARFKLGRACSKRARPSPIAIEPAASLSTSRPTPGQPAGNVEKNLCKGVSPRPNDSDRNQAGASRESTSFEYVFRGIRRAARRRRLQLDRSEEHTSELQSLRHLVC